MSFSFFNDECMISQFHSENNLIGYNIG